MSASEVTALLLDRVEGIDPTLYSYFHLFREQALASAVETDAAIARGEYCGPLHGIPLAIKDVYESGPTTAGSRILESHQAATEATAVRRLREAGGIILGKAATYEFAFGRPSSESLFPPARNPWNLDLEPGGSSNGSSVAVSAGLAYGATGTDTAGSVRWPPAQCGVVGLKPTYGRVPRTGIIPLSWSLDHAGLIARTIRDSALLLQVMAGGDRGDPTSSTSRVPDYLATIENCMARLRVGVPERLFASSCHPDILAAFEEAVRKLESLGAEIRRVDSISQQEALAITYPLLLAEAAAYHSDDLASQIESYSRDLRVFFVEGLLVDADFYLLCQRTRRQLRLQQLAQLKEVDLFALPTVGFLPDPIPERPTGLSFLSGEEFGLYTMVFNLTGLPAISIPCGFTASRLPIGLQLAGRPFEEATVLRAARAYERETGWSFQRPPLG